MITQRGSFEINAKVTGKDELKQTTESMGLLEKHLGGTAAAMVKGQLAAGALSGAFNKLKGAMGDVVTQGLTWNDWIGDNSAALDGMQQATDGIISKLDLVRARTKLTTGDFQASEHQLNAISKAAVIYARIMKVDMRNAIDSVTDAVVTGRDKAFRMLGMDIQFTGDKSQKTAQALSLLEEKFGDVTIKASNANEQIAQVTSSFGDAIGEMGHAIISSDLVQDSLSALTTIVRGLTGSVEDSSKALSDFATDYLSLMVSGGSDATKILRDAANANRKMAAETKRLNEEYREAVGMGPQNQSASAAKKTKAAKGGLRGGGKVKSTHDQLMDLIPKEEKQPELTMESFGFIDVEKLRESNEQIRRMIDLKMELNLLRVDEQAATRTATEAQTRHNRAIELGRQKYATYVNAVASAATQLGTGFVGALDAAITSGANLGWALLEVVKQTSMATAGFFFSRSAASFAAAAIAATNPFTAWEAPILKGQGWAYLGVGTLAAAGGLGLSVASAAGQSKGAFASGGSASSSTGASAGGSGGSTYRPSGGQGSEEDRVFAPTINLIVTEGDAATATYLRKKLKAEMDWN